MAWRPDHLLWGVTYLPAEVGPWLWHEFSLERTQRDFRRIRAAGFGVVRVHLAWDAFVPSARQVNRYRLRDLEALLRIAVESDLRVVPVLFAQSFGDCVLLPRYAVQRGTRSPRVRVIADGIVEPGLPRDVWADPLMLEVQVMWLEEVLRAFANHPAVLAWDLGHDPATTCRPVRIAHVETWVRLMGARVCAAADPCWMTLGAGDVLTARGMRLSVIAPHVDALGMSVVEEEPDPLWVEFVVRVAQRLASTDTSPVVGTAVEQGLAELLERLPYAGAVAVLAAQWCDLGPRLLESPPYDRQPWLAHLGVAEANGDLKPAGEVWANVARREIEAGAPAPWPEALDAEEWYENLPDASNDLFVRFRTEFGIAGE